MSKVPAAEPAEYNSSMLEPKKTMPSIRKANDARVANVAAIERQWQWTAERGVSADLLAR